MAGPPTDAPSTPTAATSTTTTPEQQQHAPATPSSARRKKRRSARVSKRDPIIVPGFGTQNDLTKLSSNLGLSIEAVKAVMESRGRGIRSRRSEAEAAPPPATPVSSAWADFMQEEGMTTTATAALVDFKEPTAETTTSSKRKSTDDETVSYKLPLTPSWFPQEDETKKKRAFKKPKFNPKEKETQHDGGVLVQTGTLDSTMIGRTKRSVMDQPFDLMVPTKLLSTSVKIKTVVAGCNAAHALAISTDGSVYGWGRNEASQLTADLPTNVPLPTLMQTVDSVVYGAVGKSHSVLLDESGQAWAVGSNKYGQCSIRNFAETAPNFRKCIVADNGVKLVQVACGENFTVAISEEGHLYTTGSSEFGQLANGETGEYFVTASKLAFANCNVFTKRTVFCYAPGEKVHGSADTNTKVVPLKQDVRLGHVACGKHHTVAVEAEATNSSTVARRVFTWGCGDYGCLGHGLQADDYYPRVVASLAQAPGVFPVSTSAGAHCSMALTNHGHCWYWGKHRPVGESTMRPALLEALANNGHVVTHASGGAQTVVCCTANAVTVAWGQGPHGELGYGASRKSSSKPDFVSSLDQCRVVDMACGYGTTLFVLKQDDAEDEAAINKLPTVDEEQVRQLLGGAEEATATAASAAGRGRPKKR